MSRVTLREIAQRLGISIGTVDRAIHNRPDVSEKTRKMVLHAVKKYGYKPDKVARMLSLKPRKVKIGVISRKEPSFYWNSVNLGIETAQKEFADFGIEVKLKLQERDSDDYLNDALSELAEAGVDGIALVPRNTSTVRNKIKQIADGGIHIATFNDDLYCSSRLFYVGPQEKQSGRIAGEMMGRFLNGIGRIIAFNIDIKSWDYAKRLEGFKEVMEEGFPGIVVTDGNLKRTAVGRLNVPALEHALSEAGRIDGIYNVDGATLAEVATIKSSIDNSAGCVMIGHEIQKTVNELINSGSITACISQDPFSQGYNVIKLLFEYLIEGKMPPYKKMYTRLDVIVRESLVNKYNLVNPYFKELY